MVEVAKRKAKTAADQMDQVLDMVIGQLQASIWTKVASSKGAANG
jgi:hypothetical protein